MDDLNVSGLAQNHSLAFDMQDAAWGETRRPLGIQDGSVRVEADRTGSFLRQFQAVLGMRLKERAAYCQIACGDAGTAARFTAVTTTQP
jgi:hypothetical protein